MTNTSVTTMSTAGTRPTHRSSQVVGGERTNDSSAAAAMGTNTACAQYRTTITRTAPANITQCFNEFDDSSMNLASCLRWCFCLHHLCRRRHPHRHLHGLSYLG